MSSKKGVPHVVTVTVYGAKGLKPKKDKHKFCVIFGIGRSKYRTDVVEDLFDNPVFNKETEIMVDNLDLELKFKVTEKNEKDVLGQVIVPLYELGEQSTSSPHKVPLRPHKKCPTPHGMLVFEAWLTEKTVEKVASRSLSLDNLKSIKSIGITSGLKKLKERIGVSAKPPPDEKQKKSSTESLFSLKARSAVSCQDVTRESHFYIPGDRHSLHSVSSEPSDFLDTISELPSNRSSLYLDKVSEFSCPRPEVTSVSPRSGPETGGTVLTIRGSNLGQNLEDIVLLNVCGSDVLETLEYISPWKLQCKTLPWNPCAGNISIETFSGGKGTSLVEFAFTEVEKPKFLIGNSLGSYSPQTSLPDIYEEGKYEADDRGGLDDQSNSNEEYGLAVPYSDSETQNSFQVDDMDLKQTSASITPSDKSSRIFSGEDGVIRLSVGGNDLKFPDNGPDATPELENPTLEDKTTNGIYLAQDSNVVRSQDYNGGNYEDELVTRVEVNRTKILVQSSFPPTEISGGQEKSDGKTVTASNGAPVKLPPPVVEIQPMRMEDKHVGAPQGRGSGGNPPQKPPRQFSGQQSSGQNSFDHTTTTLSSDLERHVDQDDLFPEKRTDNENEQMKDMEMQLLKKTNEVEMLLKLNNSLADENWRLKQYIEALVMRAIKVCPEVLCIDDSFA